MPSLLKTTRAKYSKLTYTTRSILKDTCNYINNLGHKYTSYEHTGKHHNSIKNGSHYNVKAFQV